jgi:hypothetical protein
METDAYQPRKDAHMEPLKVVAIQQPWAWAVCAGGKTVENRTWKTAHRGLLIIQASASKQRVQELIKRADSGSKAVAALDFEYGALIGAIEVLDCVPYGAHLESDPWAAGPYCWTLSKPHLFEKPIPYKGKINIYALPDEMAAKARAQLDLPSRELDATAKQACLDAVMATPEDLWSWRTDSAITLGDAETLLRCAKVIEERDPSIVDGPFYRAVAKNFSGDFEGAIRDMTDVIKRAPGLANAYFQRARAYEALAAADQEKAEELDPDLAPEEEGESEEGEEGSTD